MIIGETVRRCERNKVWTGLQPICRGQIELYTLENNPTMKQHKKDDPKMKQTTKESNVKMMIRNQLRLAWYLAKRVAGGQ